MSFLSIPKTTCLKRLGVVAIAMALCTPIHAAEGELFKVRITAEAQGTDDDAKQNAVRAAERRTVESILLNDLATEDFTPFKPLIDRCTDYLESKQILRAEAVDGSTVAEIECLVDRHRLLRDAAALMLNQRNQPPTVAVIAFQADAARQDPAQCRKVEAVIGKTLQKRKFDVVDNRLLLECLDASTALPLLAQSPRDAGTMARHGLSDVTIIATIATDIAEEENSPIHEASATVSLYVFRGCDGKLSEAIAQEAVVHSANPDEGMDAAVEDACAKFSRDLYLSVALASATPRKPGGLSITLLDIGSKERLESFIGALRELVPPAQPEVLFYSSKLARVSIAYTGSLALLNDELTARHYLDATLETREAVADSLTFCMTTQ